ncbi:hypothetical protein [Streptomyces sp. AD55]|uniref:hypothetical protein n=1 Tax=Streptomyces sp. AD55 TaxID=3242895 RepID=UPI00352908E9
MHKIATVFRRDPANMRNVLDETTPGCEWVLAGEGEATRKWDGTCVMLDDAHRWWARREVKPGKNQPPGYVAVQHDETTGKTFGWEPMKQSAYAKLHAEAVANSAPAAPGTYELLGPKINRNPDGRMAKLKARDFPTAASPVHGCPPAGSGQTTCCQRTPFELPRTDRMTTDPRLVTCPATPRAFTGTNV